MPGGVRRSGRRHGAGRGCARWWAGRRSRRARPRRAGHRGQPAVGDGVVGAQQAAASVEVVPGEGGEHRGDRVGAAPDPRRAAAAPPRASPGAGGRRRRAGAPGVGDVGGGGVADQRFERRRRGPWRPRPGHRWSVPAGSADPPRRGGGGAGSAAGGVGRGQRAGGDQGEDLPDRPHRDRPDGPEQPDRRRCRGVPAARSGGGRAGQDLHDHPVGRPPRTRLSVARHAAVRLEVAGRGQQRGDRITRGCPRRWAARRGGPGAAPRRR